MATARGTPADCAPSGTTPTSQGPHRTSRTSKTNRKSAKHGRNAPSSSIFYQDPGNFVTTTPPSKPKPLCHAYSNEVAFKKAWRTTRPCCPEDRPDERAPQLLAPSPAPDRCDPYPCPCRHRHDPTDTPNITTTRVNASLSVQLLLSALRGHACLPCFKLC